MQKQWLCLGLCALGYFAAPTSLMAFDNAQHGVNQVTFISGGVGEYSEAQMRSRASEYNLHLLFAAKDGHYLAQVPVTIMDSRGREVVNTVSEGPYLMASLPPGAYHIKAEYDGKTLSRTA